MATKQPALEDLEETSTMTVDPAVSKEQKFLETYFKYLGALDHDGAKLHFDKEKESVRSVSSGHAWSKLVSELSRLCTTERQYYQLEFLTEHRWFTRREDLKDSYTMLLCEIGRLVEIYGAQRGGTAPGWERKMASLCTSLGVYIKARRDLLEVYSDLQSQLQTHNSDVMTIEAKAVQILPKINVSSGGMLDPLKDNLVREIQILSCLLQGCVQLGNWQFLPSLFSLRSCKQKLKEWHGIPAEDKSWTKRAGRSGFSLGKSPQLPALYHWMYKFYNTLMSKFSFYFQQTLSEQCVASDMKTIMSKVDFDIVSKLSGIRRRSDLLFLGVLYDSRGAVPPYCGHGYYLPTNTAEGPVGVASYPAILAYPADYPRALWPVIVSFIQDQQLRLSSRDAPLLKFYDQCLNQSGSSRYFIMGKVELHLYLVAVFSGKKVEKDSSVTGVLNEVLAYLRLTELFSMLKAA